ncbi:hypothetical protein GGR52DRAFT_237725 [Hypoxylon sp. FL1284]|nr:hypothetical protein GGR52DRAFT_237725 [Hypoxylon sp. FL1284]
MPLVAMGSTPRTAQSPAASPAKGKGAVSKKTSGRGFAKRTGRKPLPKKNTRGKGRGQKKTYDDPRIQAAYERQRELRDLYATVSMAVKPALEQQADQNVKKLLEDPEAYKNVPEYLAVKQQLDDQLERVIANADLEHHTRRSMAERTYRLGRIRIKQSFENSFDDITEDLLDGARNRASIVEELRGEGWVFDTPDLRYEYVDHIPEISFQMSGEPGEHARKTKPVTKRKAEGQSDGQSDPKKLRHTGALLASEMQPDGVPESRAPSPSPLDEQEPASFSKKDFPEFPSGASDPDQFGVRTVDRRAKSPYNRFIVPQTFQWDDDEIGFRDSTNDSTRKATRASRGRFLNQPNSRYFHFDHTVKDYDSREYDGKTLDPEMVQKHGLHPTYGFFLPSSTNEAESPGEFVDDSRPVVFVPDPATTVHTSRSVKLKRMDDLLKEDSFKNKMSSVLGAFCQKEDIGPDTILTDEIRDRERQARERLISPSSGDASSDTSGHALATEADEADNRERANLLLQAADHLETSKPTLPPPGPRHSRPYDAVRDVFTSTEPAPVSTGQCLEKTTNSLSILADLAEDASRQQAQAVTATGIHENAMIDPRILNQVPPPPNAFLQTALNPTSAFTHAMPAHPPPMDVAQPPAPARNPFTGQGIKDSPVLPPLRPNRPDGLGKAPTLMQHQPSLPPPSHRSQDFGSPRGLVHTNSGTFYPPAPPRAFHQGFAFHEPPSMQVPIQGQPVSGPGIFANQPQIPPPNLPLYPIMSPPPMPGPSFMPMSSQMEFPAQSVSPSIPPSRASSPPLNAQNHRGSVSSNGNASGKYRKIAAAPVPHNRAWSSNGGPELRLSHYDYKESIKDYRANETPPRSGPTTIRGWNVNNVSKGRNRGMRKEDSDEKEPSNTITPFMSKWNASDRN